MIVKKTCPECEGEGEAWNYAGNSAGGMGGIEECTICEGAGYIYVEREKDEEG